MEFVHYVKRVVCRQTGRVEKFGKNHNQQDGDGDLYFSFGQIVQIDKRWRFVLSKNEVIAVPKGNFTDDCKSDSSCDNKPQNVFLRIGNND